MVCPRRALERMHAMCKCSRGPSPIHVPLAKVRPAIKAPEGMPRFDASTIREEMSKPVAREEAFILRGPS